MIYAMGEAIMSFEHIAIDTYKKKSIIGPSRVARNLKKMGSESYFIGKLSSDRFGRRIAKNLMNEGIYFNLELSDKKTPIAFVIDTLSENGVVFYRDDTADLHLSIEDIQQIHFREHDILYIDTLGLVPQATTFETHLHAMNKCHLAGGLVFFEIDYFSQIWDSEGYAKEVILDTIKHTDLIRLTEKELVWLTGDTNLESALRKLQTNQQVIFCTNSKNKISIIDHHSKVSCIRIKSRNFFTDKEGYAYFVSSLLNNLHKQQQSLTSIPEGFFHNLALEAMIEHDKAFTIL